MNNGPLVEYKRQLTCVLDFFAVVLSTSSVSDAGLSLWRLAHFIGDEGSSLIFCSKKEACSTLKVKCSREAILYIVTLLLYGTVTWSHSSSLGKLYWINSLLWLVNCYLPSMVSSGTPLCCHYWMCWQRLESFGHWNGCLHLWGKLCRLDWQSVSFVHCVA